MLTTANPVTLPCRNMALKCSWRYFTDKCLQTKGLCPNLKSKPAI